VHKTPVFGLLQPLPGDFRWNNITPESLLVVPGHVTSFPVTSLPPPASYSPVVPKRTQTPGCRVVGHLQPLEGDFRWNYVTCGSLPVATGHVTFPVTWLPPRASYSSVEAQTYTKHEFSAFYSHLQMTSGEMTSLPVTSGRAWSRDAIFCHVTAFSCELQPCRSSNVHKTRAVGLLQLLAGHFRWNDITSGLLPIALGNVTLFSVAWLPPPVRYSPV